MTTRTRLDAELATRRYTRRHAREIVTAVLGNNSGTVVATADTRWYWIRLHGDPNQVVRAWNAGFVPPVNNLPVDIEIVKGTGITDYQIIGVSINKGIAADVYAGATGMHALQHQRRDFNTGGFDPLDIYGRAIVQLRARAQTVPNMTLYVESGWFSVAGIATYFAGGNSPAFTAPGSGFRCDLLYLDNTGTLRIVTGTTIPFGTPTRPAQPTVDDLPLAYVYLTAATTSITEYLIEDGRMVFGGAGGGVGAHTILSATHSDTTVAVPADDDVLTWDTASGKWRAEPATLPSSVPNNLAGGLSGVDPFLFPIASDAFITSDPNPIGWRPSAITSRVINGVTWQVYIFYNRAGNACIAVRRVPGEWTVYATTQTFPGGGDGHNFASVGLDPHGYIHMVEGNHADTLRYHRSTLTVDSFAGVITAGLAMVGTNESNVTYPTFFNDPAGNLYFIFRDAAAGMAGNADAYFYKYNHVAATWSAAAGTGAGGLLLNGKADTVGTYWIRPCFDTNFGAGGKLHLFWTWYAAGVYNEYCYVAWDGASFYHSDGTVQAIPIRVSNDEHVDALGGVVTQPSVLHQGCYSDAGGHPHAVYARDDSDGYCYLYHLWFDGASWVKLKLSAATRVATASYQIWPVLAIDRESNTCYVAYTDHGEANSYIYFLVTEPNEFTAWAKYILYNQETDGTAAGRSQPKYDSEEWERHKRLCIPVEYWPVGVGLAPVNLLSFIPGGWALFNAVDLPQFHTNDSDVAPASLHHSLGTGANQAAAGNHTHPPGSVFSPLVAEAIAWDDMRVAGTMVRLGATAPALSAFGPSGNLKVLFFEEGHHDEVHFEIQLPHGWKEGTHIYPHVHWTPVTTEAGNVVWELEYSWKNINATFAAPSTMASDATAAGGTAWVHHMTDLKDGGGNNYIDGSGQTMSSMLVCRLHRNAGAGSDTLTEAVAFLEFDIHYKIDGLGSDTEDVKSSETRMELVFADGDVVMCEI